MSPRFVRALPGRAALCLIVLLVSACSMVSLGYRYAPTWLSWRAAAPFDLDGEQREQFRARLATVHAWHRSEALPLLLATLEEARERLAGGLGFDDGAWLADQVLAHYREVVGRIIDESADLLGTLRPEQVAALEAHLADKAAEFDESWIDASPEAVRRARYERVREQAEDWLGRLEPSQRRWLRERLEAMPVDYRQWRDDRRRRDAAFVALVAAYARGAPDPAGLRRWALAWHQHRDAELHAAAEALRRGFIALAVDLVNDATPAQREHLRARLASYASALAAEMQ